MPPHPRHPAQMEPVLHIRPAETSDADQISALVQRTIRISNAKDYSAAVIDRVVANFSPDAVQTLLSQRVVLVATQGAAVVGTASLDSDTVRTVFVDPKAQGNGIGRQLMAAVEALARRNGTVLLQVPASLTAQSFYARLGYAGLRDAQHGDERTIIMAKQIG